MFGLLVGLLSQLLPAYVTATSAFSVAYIRLDRMKVSTATGGLLCVKPTATATESKIIVTFDASFTLATAANWVLTSTDIPSGSTALPSAVAGTTTATSVSGQVVTIPTGGDLTVGTLYCADFGVANTPVTNGASVLSNLLTTVASQTAGSVQIDYSQLALATIADDQILVTAVVPPAFAFTLTNGTDTNDSLGTLNATTAGAVNSSTGVTGTVTTNAKGGWIAWAKDFDRSADSTTLHNQGLHSTTANYTIPTVGTVGGAVTTIAGGPGGAEGYVLDVNSVDVDSPNGCSTATTTPYNGTSAFMGGTFSKTFQPIATCTGVGADGTGTANGDTFTLIERVAITGATPAATDYSDLITVVAAGSF